jgi:hypothetical protein
MEKSINIVTMATKPRRDTKGDRRASCLAALTADITKPFQSWVELSAICGYKDPRNLFRIFTVAERREIELEALAIRRMHYTRASLGMDSALVRAGMAGDVAAIKLFYQRFENWNEKAKMEITGKDGAPIIPQHDFSALAEDELDELIKLLSKCQPKA